MLKKKETRAIYFDCDGEGANTYQLMFKALKKYDIPLSTLSHILRIFDENIREISMKDEHNFRLKFEGDQPKDQVMSDKELLYFLSSGSSVPILGEHCSFHIMQGAGEKFLPALFFVYQKTTSIYQHTHRKPIIGIHTVSIICAIILSNKWGAVHMHCQVPLSVL